jgi:formylglycine-generating enzyme required for sulfatase activity
MSVSPTTLNDNGAAITNCVATPALSVGLSINTSTCVISGTPTGVLSSTTYSVVATNSVGNSSAASVTLSVGASPPTLSYVGATGTSGNVGVAMSVTPIVLNNNGAAITNCVATPALSIGLSLNTSTCVISGTPTEVLPFTIFSVTATNSAGNSSAASVTLSVGASVPTLSYASSTGTSGNVGVAMSVTPTTLNINGAAITNCVATPALSVGLNLNTSTCVISGTPTGVLSSTVYSITATSSAGNSSAASVTLSVSASIPTLSYASATGTSGNVGIAMSVSPTTLNNNGAPITNCTASPALSVGLTLNTSTCAISGTPSGTLASTTYSVVATNSAGNSSAASVTLSVLVGVPTLSYASATGTSGNLGVAMSVSPTTLNNNGAAITNCTASPALSVGLSLNTSNCVISGTPTGVLASTTYSITASNSAGSSSAASVTLSVSASAPTLSYSGATGSSGNVGVAMSVTPTTLNNNGAAITNCVATPALSVGLSINTSTCVISGTPTGALASTTYSITATNSAGNSSAASVTLMVINCPSNYAQVPANPSLGVTNAFCVAQFEMKNVSSVATSQAASTPWVSISQTSAKTACTSLGTGYDLISNPEWMTIAYEIEKTSSNWSSGVVGTGMLNRGHSDNSPSSALAVTDTSDPYIGTGNNSGQGAGSGWEQRRRHTLSNGQTIWDFSGNVWEWTDWTLGGSLTSGPTSCSGEEFPNVSCGALSAADYMPDNPGGVTAANYNRNYGLGYFYGGAGGAAVRGGYWGNGAGAGAFTLDLSSVPGHASAGVGFRCVFRP